MAFQRYETGPSTTVTFRNTSLWISSGTMRLFDSEPERVSFLYDPETNRIGIINGEGATKALKLVQVGDSAGRNVAVGGFKKAFGINWKNGKYPAKWDADAKMIVVDLNDGPI